MTTAAITRIYEKLPPRKLAVLAVNAAVSQDGDELDRIIAACPRKTYTCPDIAFEFTKDALTTTLLTLGLEWWRDMTLAQTSRCGLMHAIAAKDSDETQKWLANCQKWTGLANTVDAAIHTICEESGVDEDAVRKWLNIAERTGEELNDEQFELYEEVTNRWRKSMLSV